MAQIEQRLPLSCITAEKHTNLVLARKKGFPQMDQISNSLLYTGYRFALQEGREQQRR